ncbi:MAG: IS110 family transposase [Sciscionella sp.]
MKTIISRPDPTVILGVDTHADTHTAVVIDGQGRLLDESTFTTTLDGYGALHAWACEHGTIIGAGVECTGTYGAGLARYLSAAGISVTEVNQPHAHTRAHIGKNDAIDAEAAARKVLSGQARASAKDTTGIIEAIRNINVVRSSAVKSRTQALAQIRDLLVTAPAHLRARFTAPTLPGKAIQALALRPNQARLADPAEAAKYALRSAGRRIRNLTEEITDLTAELSRLTKMIAPTLLALPQIGPVSAAQLLITTGQNPHRVHSEAAFARLTGTAPIPVASGKTNRMRLHRGGDRQANRTIHLIAVGRLHTDQRSQKLRDDKIAHGKSKMDAIRCLKRYIAREIYYALKTDLHKFDKL